VVLRLVLLRALACALFGLPIVALAHRDADAATIVTFRLAAGATVPSVQLGDAYVVPSTSGTSVNAVVDDSTPGAQFSACGFTPGPATSVPLTSGERDPVAAAVGRLALDAIALLSDPEERARLRTCGLDSCGAVFLTPAGHRERRWCSMVRCGNRAKVTAFRRRTKTPNSV